MNRNRYLCFYMNTADLLDKVFDLYKKTIGYQILKSFIFGAVALVVIPIIIIIASLVIAPVLAPLIYSVQSPVAVAILLVVVIAVPIVILICIWEAFEISGGVLLARQAFYGKKVDLGVIFSQLRTSFIPAFTTLLAIVVIFFPAVILFGGIIYLIIVKYYSFLMYTNDFLSIFNSLLGLSTAIALTMLVCWNGLHAFLTCSMPIAICEGKGGFSSVKQSVSLLKGSYVKTFGTLILWMLISLVTQNSFSGIIALASQMFGFFSESPVQAGVISTVIAVLNYFLTLAVSILMRPFDDILSSTIYFNQKILKDGLDIIIELENIPNTGE